MTQFSFTQPTAIVGMGNTGLSCAKFLSKNNCPYVVLDSRQSPPLIGQFEKLLPDDKLLIGDFDFELLKKYSQIIVSPGISIRDKIFQALQAEGCFILGDIELFFQNVSKPVIAITGSNGKSTVTTLVEKIAQGCGIKAIAGGNLGTPALDLFETHSDLYILELSSFQLETTYSMKTLSATVLNVSEDHMDRYHDIEDYRQVKESIYQNCQWKVFNRDENPNSYTASNDNDYENYVTFGHDEPKHDQYGLTKENHHYLLKKGDHTIIESKAIKLTGTYNYMNVLAAVALLEPLKLDESIQQKVISEFSGLSHRCEWVDEIQGVQYYNDSKGTNTGATIAAINGFESVINSSNGRLFLIAGGVGKDADFDPLAVMIKQKVYMTLLLGQDASIIRESALVIGVPENQLILCKSMQEAVATANELANEGDIVLLSPACASFDLYENYVQRGNDFKSKVHALKENLNHVN